MAQTAYQIKKALGLSRGLRAKSENTESLDVLKADIKAGKYEHRFNLLKKDLESDINFTTIGTDLASMSKTIEDVSTNWQSPEAMKNKRVSVELMQRRLGAYKEYQRLFGEEGKEISKKVLADYANEYGQEMADILAGYANTNFNMA